jgi:flagellar biosynthetic protein FliR
MELAPFSELPVLPAARVLAIATGFPLLAGPGAPMHARLAVTGALAFVLVPRDLDLAQVVLSPGATLLALPFEFLIGAAIGYAFSLVFHLLAIAGDFAGQEMGLNSANQIDPTTGQPVPLLSRLFEAIGFVIFAECGGLAALLRTVRSSFDLLPSGAVLAPDRFGANIAGASTLAIQAGIALALPAALALFLVTVFTTVASRALPRLHIFDFALAVRLMIAIGLIAILVPHLVPTITRFSDFVAEAVYAGLEKR